MTGAAMIAHRNCRLGGGLRNGPSLEDGLREERDQAITPSLGRNLHFDDVAQFAARNSKVGRSTADGRRDFDPPAVLPEVIASRPR